MLACAHAPHLSNSIVFQLRITTGLNSATRSLSSSKNSSFFSLSIYLFFLYSFGSCVSLMFLIRMGQGERILLFLFLSLWRLLLLLLLTVFAFFIPQFSSQMAQSIWERKLAHKERDSILASFRERGDVEGVELRECGPSVLLPSYPSFSPLYFLYTLVSGPSFSLSILFLFRFFLLSTQEMGGKKRKVQQQREGERASGKRAWWMVDELDVSW